MKFDENASPGFVHPFRHAVYNSSIAHSATASTASLWSDASSQISDSSSQTSDDVSSVSGNSSDGESCDSQCHFTQTCHDGTRSKRASRQAQAQVVPVELRQNPRRTAGHSGRRGNPPSLVRQADRKVNFDPIDSKQFSWF